MLDHRCASHSGIRSAELGRHIGVTHGHAANVRLVYNSIVPRHTGWSVVTPSEGRIDYPAFGCSRSTVAFVEGKILFTVADAIAEVRITPDHVALQMLGIGLDQQ